MRADDKDESLDADAVLIAAGLVPRSEMLNGIKKGSIGEVIVDDHMQTSVPDVYACGDVIGPPYLTPVARHQGIVAADNILGIPRTMDIPYHPAIDQPLAGTGILHPETKDAHHLRFPDLQDRAHSGQSLPVIPDLQRLWLIRITGHIEGICAAGPGGGLIAGYMAFLMSRHFSVHDFEEFIEVHPSTDGVYGLAKYASGMLKKQKNDHNAGLFYCI